MKTVLIIGATRNLGKALATHYISEPNTTIYATARYGKPLHHTSNIHWISGIDISHEDAGQQLIVHYNNEFPIDIVYFVATATHDIFAKESLEDLKFEKELKMYKTSVIGPIFLVQQLLRANILAKGAKIIFLATEAGSISLRTSGGNYGFHGSQAALNMTAKLLSLDLAPKNVSVGVVYPGRIAIAGERDSEKLPDEVQPEVGAKALVEFVEKEFNMEKTGQVWSSRGFNGVPVLDSTVLDHNLHSAGKSMQLPW
jgi:NAD(P)-dependent dehydrogenase (short-subunit alcohol dehydrogenase family)